eukprot:scaffold33193_cov70-Cyclotella_meneghiniana.AAC.7
MAITGEVLVATVELMHLQSILQITAESVEPVMNDRIRCIKSAMTPQCKLCMVERKEICHRLQENKQSIINDNSDIFSSCKCRAKFHKFGRNLHIETLRTRITQEKVNSTRHSKAKRTRFFPDEEPSTPSSCKSYCHPCKEERSSPASLRIETPVFLIDTNVPGLPYRSPSANPSNLKLAQVQHYIESCTEIIVV